VCPLHPALRDVLNLFLIAVWCPFHIKSNFRFPQSVKFDCRLQLKIITSRRQKPTSYFPYIMYNAKKKTSWMSNTKKYGLIGYYTLLYSYYFNPIESTHLRHVTVHYFSRIAQPESVFFRIGHPRRFFFRPTVCERDTRQLWVTNLIHPLARDVKDTLLTRKIQLTADSDSNSLLGVLLLVCKGSNSLVFVFC
jgi:hypothetical protein